MEFPNLQPASALREELQCCTVNHVWQRNNHFLYAEPFHFLKALPDYRRRSQQPASPQVIERELFREFCCLLSHLGIGLSNTSVHKNGPADLLRVASDVFTVPPKKREFVCHLLRAWMGKIAGIAIVSHQLERNL